MELQLVGMHLFAVTVHWQWLLFCKCTVSRATLGGRTALNGVRCVHIILYSNRLR